MFGVIKITQQKPIKTTTTTTTPPTTVATTTIATNVIKTRK